VLRPAEAAFARAFGLERRNDPDAFGYKLCLSAALRMLQVLDTAAGLTAAQQRAQLLFVASALDLMSSNPSDSVRNACSAPEAALVSMLRQLLRKSSFLSSKPAEAMAQLAAAWERLQSSGALDLRNVQERMQTAKLASQAVDQAAAAEAAARGLRECSLGACAACEVHVAQFKKCTACQQAWYCCKEHQVADWPSHKAACKAARKAAAAQAGPSSST
jgi:hypothetical protein